MDIKIILIFTAFFSWKVNATNIVNYDVSKAWNNSVVYVPEKILSTDINSVDVKKPLPVVLFLHGCGGINDHERKWGRILKSEGFIVILPNSLSIPNREINCVSATNTRNIGKVPVHDLRPAEAEFAMSQLKMMKWADKNNIFLMGHSEGGMGAFLTKDIGFKGVIVSGFNCGIRKKIGSNYSTPFLALNWEIDPYFSKDNLPQKQCSDRPFWRDRLDKQELILKGKGHATGFEDSANNAVIKFINDRIN